MFDRKYMYNLMKNACMLKANNRFTEDFTDDYDLYILPKAFCNTKIILLLCKYAINENGTN